MTFGITRACMYVCMLINILVTSFVAENNEKLWKIKRCTRKIEGSWSI